MTDRLLSRWRWLALVAGAGIVMAGCAAPASTGSAPSGTGLSASGTSDSGGTSRSAAGTGQSAAGSAAPALPQCPAGALPTVAPGILTVGTSATPVSPWYIGDPSADATGLEPSVAVAIGSTLGYTRDDIVWTTVDPAAARAGTAAGFDIDLNQFTAADSGTATADYSTGYYSITDTLVMPATVAQPPATVQDAATLTVAAVSGSSAASTAKRVTGRDPVTFAEQGQALASLATGSVPALVLPTPAALAAAAADPAVRLVGQLPTDPSVQPDQLKVLLAKDSPLTGCVSAAIDRLRVEGTLDQLATQWINPLIPQL
ncbi:MAG: transporter substrate-binding domain-containing protein, partial [Nakamurella sp.]